MKITSTKNLILQSLYEPLPQNLHLQLELDLALNFDLTEEQNLLESTRQILSFCRLTPGKQSIQKLLQYSRKAAKSLPCT
jgi:hypothetical protein